METVEATGSARNLPWTENDSFVCHRLSMVFVSYAGYYQFTQLYVA